MEGILKRIGLILMITHACTIVGMENHDWWQNGRDADPTPPTKMNLIHALVEPRVAMLPPDVGAQVWNSISEGLINSKEFSVNDAAKILERFEDEQDRLELEEEEADERRFWFFDSSPTPEDDAERDESDE